MHRFIGKFPISDEKFWIGDNELVHQIKDVLRLRAGEKIILVGENAKEAICEIIGFDGEYLGVKVLENTENKNDPESRVELYLAVLKNENFELAVQKAVEVGVSNIIPIITERTIKTGLKIDRLKKIMKEASEQSGRGVVPNVVEPMDFKNAIKLAKSNDVNIFYDSTGKENLKVNSKAKKIGVFVGPEGGWSEKEISMARVARFEAASFGKLIYRAETAAMIAVYEAVKIFK